MFGVENNQVLIRKYEIIDRNFSIVKLGEVSFRKHPHEPDDINEFGFFDIFTLTKYFINLLEEPVDEVTWLRIKQPGTYTLHFDLIPNSFSFELHTRDEIIHFSEHNPKHNINLEKGENCLLVYKG